MMYIKRIPLDLEDSLHYTLTPSRLETNGILHSHAQRSHNSVGSTELELKAVVDIAAACATSTVNGESDNKNSSSGLEENIQTTPKFAFKKQCIEQETTRSPAIGRGSGVVSDSVNNVKKGGEDCSTDEEDYEIIDVCEGAEEEEEVLVEHKQKEKDNEKIKKSDSQSENIVKNEIVKVPGASSKISEICNNIHNFLGETENEDNVDNECEYEFEIILKRCPKSFQQKLDAVPDGGARTSTPGLPQSSTPIYPPNRVNARNWSPSLSAIPEAIPIQSLAQPPPKRIRRRSPIRDNIRISALKTNSYIVHIDHNVDEEEYNYDNNERGDEYDFDNLYEQEEPSEDSQMGWDVLSKLRHLLRLDRQSINSSSNNNKTGTNDRDVIGVENRKRRFPSSSENSLQASSSSPFKYRRVNNTFPDFVPQALDNDDSEFLYVSSSTALNRSKATPKTLLRQNAMENSNRRPLNEIAKTRRSFFNPPNVSHKLVQNTAYADIEFSDDEDPEFSRFDLGGGNRRPVVINGRDGNAGRGIQSMIRNNPSGSAFNPRVNNIPIQLTSETHRERLNRHTTLNTDCSTLMTIANGGNGGIGSGSMRPMTYAEALKPNGMKMGSGYDFAGRVSSLSRGGGDGSFAVQPHRPLNGIGGSGAPLSVRTNPRSSRSILAQENDNDEHERYQELLRKLMPKLYGQEGFASMSQISRPTKPSRAELMVDAARNSSANGSLRKSLTSSLFASLKRPPLSSTTINLDDDDDANNDNDVSITGVTVLKPHQKRPSGRENRYSIPTVVIDDDDDIEVLDRATDDNMSDIIILDDEDKASICTKLRRSTALDGDRTQNEAKAKNQLPFVEPVNTLAERFKTSPHLKDNWLEQYNARRNLIKANRRKDVEIAAKEAEKVTAERLAAEQEIYERLRKFQIPDPELVVLDEFTKDEKEVEFFDITQEHQKLIAQAIQGKEDAVLISKFNLNITRRDILTLVGLNWLNDEIINFYMNLLTERGEKKHESHGYPSVYAMNTFFVPRLMQAGHSGVKRWTRKVDIFAKDIIPVPVHVGNVHWCMAIIHLKDRTIRYYDSMGSPNPMVLAALEQYLKDESLDKRKQPFDMSDFTIESVRDVPRQNNGSDCGVFSCMFAEYITRNKPITFTQANMPYFRHKMILEITRGELLQ